MLKCNYRMAVFEEFLGYLEDSLRLDHGFSLIGGGDFNAHSSKCGRPSKDVRGISDLIVSIDVTVQCRQCRRDADIL